jgi:osomolarity two-component system sensor histidine kinase TcsA
MTASNFSTSADVHVRSRQPVGDSLALEFFRYTPIPTIIFDPSLVVLEISESYLEVSSTSSREEVLGYHADDFFNQKVTLPSLASVRKAIRAAQESCLPYELEHSQPEGTTWSIRIVPIFRHGSVRWFQMELTDITEEHRRHLELEERLYTNETFRILVETVKDYAIFMLDPTGHVATWNAGAQCFKGYTKDEIIGRHFSSFYGQEDRGKSPHLWPLCCVSNLANRQTYAYLSSIFSLRGTCY